MCIGIFGHFSGDIGSELIFSDITWNRLPSVPSIPLASGDAEEEDCDGE